MPRKKSNRGYKKGEPFRDSRLFIISCEGEDREKKYFEFLTKNSLRVQVKILAPIDEEKGKSSPNWVLDRAARYEEEIGLKGYDKLWLVIDVDKWKKETLIEVGKQCLETKKWNIAISNPCFELWLLLHIRDVDWDEDFLCGKLKTVLHKSVKGGYKVENFIPLINDAIGRSEEIESNLNYFFPEKMETKIHHLAKELMEFLEK